MIIAPARFGLPPSWHAASLPSPNLESTAWSGYTMRQRIDSALIPSTGSLIRFSIQGGASEAITITNAYAGICASGVVPDFASTPVQVFFNGGSAGCVAAINTQQESDSVSLVVGSGQSVVIALYTDVGNTSADNYRVSLGTTGLDSWYKNANDASSVTTSGYTFNNHQQHIITFEVFGP